MASLGIGLFVSLPASAIVFNLLPQVAYAVAPLVCAGAFVIHPSGRRRSHEYLCEASAGGAPRDVTTLASALTWTLLWLALSLLVYVLLARREARASSAR